MIESAVDAFASRYPPEIRQRWRLLKSLEDHRVRLIAGWDYGTYSHLFWLVDHFCEHEPEVGRWPVLRLSLKGEYLKHRRAKHYERRLVELGAIIPRGSRTDLKPHWYDPETDITYHASGIDLSPMEELATSFEAEAPRLMATWKERMALHDPLRRLLNRMDRRIRAEVRKESLSESQASEIRARLPKIPHFSDVDARELRRRLRIAESVETEFRQRITTTGSFRQARR